MPSSGPALLSAPTSTIRRPMEAPSSATRFLASESPPQMSRSHSMSCSVAESSCAAMWWNAPTTRASAPSISCASSADEPWGGGVNRRGPPKVSGTTVETTTLPRHASRTSGSVAARPPAGSAITTISAAAAASRLLAPVMRAPDTSATSSAAFARARSASREPMTISCPAWAHRTARPAPSLPVPPRMPIFMGLASCGSSPEEVSRGIALQRPAVRFCCRPSRAANEDDGDAIELAHHRLGRGGQLVGHREDGRLQHVARGVGVTEIADDGLDTRQPDRHVDQALAPRPPERIGDDDGQHVAGELGQALAEGARGGVGVRGKEARSVAVHVGLVHARVRADPSVMRLHDQDALGLPHDAAALAEDDLDEARVAVDLGGERGGAR